MCEICGHSPCLSYCPNAEFRVYCLCWRCGSEIREGDNYYDMGGEIWCEECVSDRKRCAEFNEDDFDE